MDRGAGSAVRRIGRGKTPSPRSVPGLRQGSSSSLSFCLRDWRKRPRFRLAPSAPDRRASPESHPRAVLVPAGTPESVTPSASHSCFPARFVCPILFSSNTLTQPRSNVNHWRTFIHIRRISPRHSPGYWAFSQTKFTVWPFFREKGMIY